MKICNGLFFYKRTRIHTHTPDINLCRNIFTRPAPPPSPFHTPPQPVQVVFSSSHTHMFLSPLFLQLPLCVKKTFDATSQQALI